MNWFRWNERVFPGIRLSPNSLLFFLLVFGRDPYLYPKNRFSKTSVIICHIVKGTTLFLLAQQTGHFAIICHKMPCFFKLDILKFFTFTQ